MAKKATRILQMKADDNAPWVNCESFDGELEGKSLEDRVKEVNETSDRLGLGVKFRTIEADATQTAR